jgi:hypothetical protein
MSIEKFGVSVSPFVDGTNGDTALERVEAPVIETLIVARGAVVRTEDVKGRRISLDVANDDGRLEDVLRLAVNATKPVITGRMQLRAKLLLPAGDPHRHRQPRSVWELQAERGAVHEPQRPAEDQCT